MPAEARASRGSGACRGGSRAGLRRPAGLCRRAAGAASRRLHKLSSISQGQTISLGAPGAPAPVNTVLAARGRPEGSAAAAALAGGDSLAAMEAFTALAARHEQARPAREEVVEHLNETSFDWRRQVAVYKNDGKRGHHMQARSRPRRAPGARPARTARAATPPRAWSHEAAVRALPGVGHGW